jgi:hypothetical protein
MTSYLDLTNRLLRRLNEVEIQDSDFLSAKGIQATAKDAILDTLREISERRTDWGFNAVQHEQVLGVGVEEYAWYDDFSTADWSSFVVKKDPTLNINTKPLIPIQREDWYNKLKSTDYDSESGGRGVPDYVCATHGNGWAVSPSPDKTYTIQYRYYKAPTDLVNSTDTTEIPTRFDYVIIAGALVHMGLFKEDNELVAINQQKFEKGLATMVQSLTASPEYIHSTMVIQRGMGNGSYGYWWR